MRNRFVCVLKVTENFDTDPHPDPLVRDMDRRISYQNVTDPEHCMEQIDVFLFGLTGIAVLGILDHTDTCVLM
jgi:hypothetical protein